MSAVDLALGVGPLHLDHHLLPAGQPRAVHLADRGRGDRHLVELLEDLLDGQAELLPRSPGAPASNGSGLGVVLQAAQLGQDVRRHDVGPRREQLAELDEGRAPARRASRAAARPRLRVP